MTPTAPWACGQSDIDRWNEEWLHYLGREWERQLEPHTSYPNTPPLPENPLDLLEGQVVA